MKNKTYTIGIPVFERLFGFEEAIQSALSVKECTEILVLDDNSSHNKFKEICNTINDVRVRYIRNQQNIGLFGNWNKLVEYALGEYISILCSDDLINSNVFELFLDAYKTNEDIDVFFGSFTIFNATIDDSKVLREFNKGKMNSIDLLIDLLNNGPAFPVMTIMRKEIAIKYPFVSNPHSGNDWLWIYSNAMSLKLHATSKTINYWRRHADQDAVKSQSITMDCWPMMYWLISHQLKEVNKDMSKKALRRAKGIILTWILNEYNKERVFQKRFLQGANENNVFLDLILKIINEDWLLLKLINTKKNIFIYNFGRLYRKFGYYPN